MPPNRVIELGAYRIRGGRIVDNFLTLVNPEIPIPRFVISLTGITNEMVRSAPVFADLAPRWLDFVSDAVLVAHNAPFDTSFLNHETRAVSAANDNLTSARKTFAKSVSGMIKLSLDTSRYFSIPICIAIERYDALAMPKCSCICFEFWTWRKDIAAARRFNSSNHTPATGLKRRPLRHRFQV